MVKQIEAIVFDMDGVLIDTERLSTKAWYDEAEAMQIGNIEVAVNGCVGLNITDTRAFFLKEYGPEFPFDTFMTNASKRFNDAIETDSSFVKKGAKEILKYLKSTEIKIALASSTKKKSVIHHLEKAGLNEYFEVMITGDMVEHSKPQPDIYLMALKELNVTPEHAIAIEDSPNGIRSAYVAGMKPIMVPDMIAPTAEIEKLLYAKYDSLFDVMEMLKNN